MLAFDWGPERVSKLTVDQLLFYGGVARAKLDLPLGLPQVGSAAASGEPTESHGSIENKDYTVDFKDALASLKERTGKESFHFAAVYAEMKKMQKEQSNGS